MVTAGNPSGKGSGMVATRSSPHCTNCCRIDEEKKRNDADNEEGVTLHHSAFIILMVSYYYFATGYEL